LITAHLRDLSARRTLAELLIDCEEDRALRAVLVGMPREADRLVEGARVPGAARGTTRSRRLLPLRKWEQLTSEQLTRELLDLGRQLIRIRPRLVRGQLQQAHLNLR
jgi:hypothetical protein